MNRHLKSLLIAALLPAVCATSARSEGTPPEAEVQALGEYEVKNQSSFNLADSTRPPFWPIGWVKQARLPNQPAAAPVARLELTAEMFAFTSVLLGTPSLAVINGRAYGEGEAVRVPKRAFATAAAGAPRPRVVVQRIGDGKVTLQSTDGQRVDVPLRRQQLSGRKPPNDEELLFNDDEE